MFVKIMNKRYILIFTIIALLLASCEANLNNIDPAVETASVTLKITNNTESRSILPAQTDIESYSVTLQNGSNSYTAPFKKDSEIKIDSVLVGEYTVTVDGCSDAESTVKVATGSTELTVKADEDNTVSVTLDWLDKGEGSFSVDIDWRGLTKEDNFLYKAIKDKSLGFQAWDTENNKPFNNAGIQWVDDASFTAETFTYTQTNIPTQKDKRSTNISFRIYSKMDEADQVIAETFYTTVTIFANITSYPDGNESFSLKNENIVYYLKNVTGVTSSLNTEDSAKKVDVSWSYPSLNDGNYLLKVWITNNNTNEIVGTEKSINYSVLNTIATGTTTATFDGVTPDYSYTVHFINYTNDTNLVYSYSVETTPLDDIKTKVKVTSISFASGFGASYVMGDSVSVNANIAPYNATVTGYTVSAPGLTLSDKTVSFDKSGDYTITITSDDGDAVKKTASTTVTVKLATPQNFTLEKTAEGMALSWSAVDTATSYSIKKTSSEGEETLTADGTSYTDSTVKTGVEYTYSVKAVRSDNAKFDSSYTEEEKETIKNTFITVTAPTNLTSENFKPILEEALEGQFVTDLKGITITIDTSSSTLLSSENTTFTWLLNGKEIGNNNSNTVDVDRTNVYINSHESSNTLQLTAKNGDYTYSASAIVHYIERDPGELTITTTEDTVTYGKNIALELETTTANGVDCAVSWTSSNPEVATVDSEGKVTALIDGSTTITATIVATGESATKTIKTYIPVERVEIAQSSANWLAIKKDGVSVTDAYRTKTLTAKIVPANGIKATNETLTWSTSNNNNSVSLSSYSGKTTTVTSMEKGNAGSPKVTVSGADGKSAELTIPVYTFDIYYNGNSITNHEQKMTGNALAWEYNTYNVCAYINGNTASALNVAYFNWTAGSSYQLKLTQASDTYNYRIEISTNGYTFKVTSTIYDRSTGNKVGEMWFTRKAT